MRPQGGDATGTRHARRFDPDRMRGRIEFPSHASPPPVLPVDANRPAPDWKRRHA